MHVMFPEQRYLQNYIPNTTTTRLVIPTPMSIMKTDDKPVNFDPKIWTVLPSNDFPKEVSYLTGKKCVSWIPDRDFREPDRGYEMSSYMRGVRPLSCMTSV